MAFLAHQNGGGSTGNLYVVDGGTGVEHWRLSGTFGRVYSGTYGASSLAAGDLDGDGIAELVVANADEFRIIEHDGTEGPRIPVDLPQRARGHALSLADVNQDGIAEIIDLATVVSSDGSWQWRGAVSGGDGQDLSWSLAADLRPEIPGLELFAGNALYDATGAVLWQVPTAEGSAAFGDVDGDGFVEIVLSAGRELHLLDVEGAALLPARPLGGGLHEMTSVPLLAELDGDPAPELVLAANSYLSAMEWDASGWRELWRENLEDPRGAASVTAYDLDGDGIDELFHRDFTNWYVRDGRCGSVLHEEYFPSETGVELPVIANIDSDPEPEPEILVSQYTSTNYEWIYLIAYELPGACPARSIWNQASYHFTNIDDDASIPRIEQPHWEVGAAHYAQSHADRDTEISGFEPVLVAPGGACAGSVQLSWQPAVLSDGSAAVYDVWRLPASAPQACCDPASGVMVAQAHPGTSLVDDGAAYGAWVRYLVRARPAEGRCPSLVHCSDVVLLDDPNLLPAPPGGLLRVEVVRDVPTVHWLSSRAPLVDEHFHLLRALGSPASGFVRVTPEGTRDRSYSENHEGPEPAFYDLRVVDSCENESLP